MTTRGVDTTDHTLTGATLKASGYAFVCRYYQYGGTNPGKQLTAAEAVEKSAAGIRIVSNYETDGNPDNTVATGERHARNFLAQHADVGGPDWAPCYFSIDLAVNPSSRDLYMKGLGNVLGVDRVGVYAEDALIVHARAAGLISYGWRSMSSSFPGNPGTVGCNLIQTGSGHVGPHSVDFDTALTDLYGGWLLGEEDPNMALTQDDIDNVAAAVVTKLKADVQWVDLTFRTRAIAMLEATIGSGTDKGKPVAITAALAAIPLTAVPANPADAQAIADEVLSNMTLVQKAN